MITISDCHESLSMGKKLNNEPVFSVKEAAEKVNISSHTLRYYDKMKLFPFVTRNTANARLFSEIDIEWIRLVECLRSTGMSLAEVQHYVDLCLEGESTINERVDIIVRQEAALCKQIEDMKNNLKLLQFKKTFYLDLIQNGKKEDILNPITHSLKKC